MIPRTIALLYIRQRRYYLKVALDMEAADFGMAQRDHVINVPLYAGDFRPQRGKAIGFFHEEFVGPCRSRIQFCRSASRRLRISLCRVVSDPPVGNFLASFWICSDPFLVAHNTLRRIRQRQPLYLFWIGSSPRCIGLQYAFFVVLIPLRVVRLHFFFVPSGLVMLHA